MKQPGFESNEIYKTAMYLLCKNRLRILMRKLSRSVSNKRLFKSFNNWQFYVQFKPHKMEIQ